MLPHEAAEPEISIMSFDQFIYGYFTQSSGRVQCAYLSAMFVRME